MLACNNSRCQGEPGKKKYIYMFLFNDPGDSDIHAHGLWRDPACRNRMPWVGVEERSVIFLRSFSL